MTDYQLATAAALSALAIVLGLLAWKEADWRLRRRFVERRGKRRGGWLV